MSESARQRRRAQLALCAGLSVVVLAGWDTFWFLTDDAFIAFRYAANARAGHGLTWNAPPFLPVEGYTSFLWVKLLQWVWQLTGVAPPQAANMLSLGCGGLQLWLAHRLLEQISLPPPLEARRVGLQAATLFAIATHHTFLVWLSGGMETALFNCLLLWWILEALGPEPVRARSGWLPRLGASNALVALTRPDGLLLLAPTLVLVLLEARRRRSVRAVLAGIAPLSLVAAHLGFRRATYGEWLPNTYFAKAGSAWPESGLRHLGCFVVEQGAWVWVLVAASWLLVRGARPSRGELQRRLPVLLVAGTLLAHLAYYVLLIGGDHFEYRIYSHLIAPLLVSLLWLAAELRPNVQACFAALLGFWLAALPLPWLQDFAVRDLTTRAQTASLAPALAPYFPAPLRPLIEARDRTQRWLVTHRVGVSRKELAAFPRFLEERLAASGIVRRASGQRIVIVSPCVGVLGWMWPSAAILDAHGLSDRVIARSPRMLDGVRKMAHEHEPPAGYIECFRPALQHTCADLRPLSPPPPTSDAEIVRCERLFGRPWSSK